ncbi:platelet-derived growth factor receptor-like protein [Puma concolor]|uniref:Platelet-derived growth factor receptor-like protein n=1 Tax=Puma concolor TaxID=9696 RepID=A0A6P6ILQ3_PUMCO|nr:platelet-derived growth factor receptor-like protein [Puma concolor]
MAAVDVGASPYWEKLRGFDAGFDVVWEKKTRTMCDSEVFILSNWVNRVVIYWAQKCNPSWSPEADIPGSPHMGYLGLPAVAGPQLLWLDHNCRGILLVEAGHVGATLERPLTWYSRAGADKTVTQRELQAMVFLFVTGQQPPKNKRPKEPGENRIKPTNKKVKPRIPKIKDRDAADGTPKTQSIMIQMLDKGRFQKPAATLSLTAGQTLELRCKGNKIGWSYPPYLDTFKDSRLSVRQHERYGQLTLVNSTAADTGEFSCWGQLCQGYVCRKDETKTGSTYIFFTEKGELFVPSPSYFDVVYLNPDRQAVVPCRVTVPSARVTLHREFPAKEIPANGTDIVYDMKRGFVYLQPHSDHQGVVYCKAEAGGKSQISVKYQLLYVEVPRGPPSTTILASSNRVRSGDDISVLCTVLGEPDVEVEFRWIYPGQKDERPVTIQDTWRLIHRGLGHTTRISQSILTVEDVATTDVGYYICTARNLQGETTVATTVEFS